MNKIMGQAFSTIRSIFKRRYTTMSYELVLFNEETEHYARLYPIKRFRTYGEVCKATQHYSLAPSGLCFHLLFLEKKEIESDPNCVSFSELIKE